MIKLVKMSKKNYDIFYEKTKTSYAEDIAISRGFSLKDSMVSASEQMNELLSAGIETSDNNFYDIICNNERIGWLWIALKEQFNIKTIFIYDIFIEENCRGKGRGRMALEKLEDVAKKININRIGLHVFRHSQNAFKLYKKMGYMEKGISMRKDL